MVSIHIFTEQTDIFTARGRPWCQAWIVGWGVGGRDARRRVRRYKKPPVAQTQGTLSRKGRSRNWREKPGFQFFLKRSLVSVEQVGRSPESA